ncbi:MAG: hypothetical protein H0W88_05605 [Parachlamydiaceae bacterium]|nr:hypothetical protein [Parachlamydiaceae bacterium]
MSTINTNISIVSQGGQVTQPLITQNLSMAHVNLHLGAGPDLHEHTIEKMLDILDDPGFSLTGIDRLINDIRILRSDNVLLRERIKHLQSQVPTSANLEQIKADENNIKNFEEKEILINKTLVQKLHDYLPKMIENVNTLIVDLKLPHANQIQYHIGQFDKNKIIEFKDYLINFGNHIFFKGQSYDLIKESVHKVIDLQHKRNEELKAPQENLVTLREELNNIIERQKTLASEIEELNKNPTEDNKIVIETLITEQEDIAVRENDIDNHIVKQEEIERIIILTSNSSILHEKEKLLDRFNHFLPHPTQMVSSVQQKVATNVSDQGIFGLQQTQKHNKVKSKTKKMKPKKNRGTKV